MDNYHDIGYPIADVSADGSFVLTKHPKTGGMVSVDTVREQVFYEMGDPTAYITPDVIADFSTIHLEQEAIDQVKVSGIKGYEPTSHYKVSMAYENGYKAIGSIIISGPKAKEKADRFADIFWKRCQKKFSETLTECVGWDACHRSLGLQNDCSEILLRLGVRSPDKQAVISFSRLVSSLVLSGPPGVSVLGGVPKVQTIINYWPALIDKRGLDPSVMRYHGDKNCSQEKSEATVIGQCMLPAKSNCQTADNPTKTIEATLMEMTHPEGQALSHICLARSGDKGDSVNIGLLARGKDSYQFIKHYFTAQRIKNLFQELCLGRVSRYSMDGLLGLNFILEKSLGGGGSRTLRVDSQGKTFSQALLRQKIKFPESLRHKMSS